MCFQLALFGLNKKKDCLLAVIKMQILERSRKGIQFKMTTSTMFRSFISTAIARRCEHSMGAAGGFHHIMERYSSVIMEM